MARILEYEKDDLPKELAKLTITHQNKALASKPWFDVAISGGSLAKTMAAGLLHNPEVKWKQWRVWLADERIVALDHDDSNMRVFIEEVYNKLPESERPKLEPLSSELLKNSESTPTAKFAEEYQQRLVSALGKQPVIDLIYLGMGPDGHTCSLFPGDKLLDEWNLLVAPIDNSPKPPPRRITITKPVLKVAPALAFVTTGEAKREAIHRIFALNDTSLPSKQVNDLAEGEVLWFADKAALGSEKLA